MTEGVQSQNPEGPRIIQTPELIKKVNSFLGTVGDETRVINFQVLSDRDQHGKLKTEAREHNASIETPLAWFQLLYDLDPAEKSLVMTAINQVVRSGYETCGDIRNATVEEIAAKRIIKRPVTGTGPVAGGKMIGKKRAHLIKELFKSLVFTERT